jgi:putative transposase
MRLADKFGFFDPKQPYTVSYGELPHWEQEGATYFITFRTADSLPAAVMQLWERERDDWLLRHGIDSTDGDWRSALRNRSHVLQRQFQRLFASKLEKSLDQGHGDCVLQHPELARVVANSLLHFDGEHLATLDESVLVAESLRDSTASRSDSATSAANQPREVRYHVSDFVVMPNHVHVMVCFLPGTRLRDQCYSWKHFTSWKINRLIGRIGEFWQSESFDHLVRDADHFHRFRKYIADNPKKANLKPDQAIHYQSPNV